MKMPWGKHKGEDLEDIETSYLFWVMENCDITRQLHRAIQAALVAKVEEWAPDVEPPRGRKERDRDPFLDGTINSRLPIQLVPQAEEILKAGYRAVASRLHPDKPGGDGEAMKLLNLAKEQLERMIKG